MAAKLCSIHALHRGYYVTKITKVIYTNIIFKYILNAVKNKCITISFGGIKWVCVNFKQVKVILAEFAFKYNQYCDELLYFCFLKLIVK